MDEEKEITNKDLELAFKITGVGTLLLALFTGAIVFNAWLFFPFGVIIIFLFALGTIKLWKEDF